MAKVIQVRNVPDALHRKLKARAARAGMSLSDYLLAEMKRSAEQLTNEEIVRRLRKLSRVEPELSPAELIREMRDKG